MTKCILYFKIRILFLLLEDGILVSTDLTNIKKSWTPQNAFFWIIFNEINTSVILIIVINLFTLVVYSRYFRRNNTVQIINNNVAWRNQEINQVLRDVMRANNPVVEPQNIAANVNPNNNDENNQNINDQANINQNNLNNNNNQNLIPNNIDNLHEPNLPNNEENSIIQPNILTNDINEISENEVLQHKTENLNNTNIPSQIEEEKTSDDSNIQKIIENNKFLREIQSLRFDNPIETNPKVSDTLKLNNENQISEENLR